MQTETRANAKAAMTLPPSLGRPRRRTGHPLGHDHLDMPVTRHAGHRPGRRFGWFAALRERLRLTARTSAI